MQYNILTTLGVTKYGFSRKLHDSLAMGVDARSWMPGMSGFFVGRAQKAYITIRFSRYDGWFQAILAEAAFDEQQVSTIFY